MTMRFEVLGPLVMRLDGRDVTPRGARVRRLLAALLVADGVRVTDDRLSELLWNGEGTAARLQLLVHRLRSTLDEADRLVREPDGYRLIASDDELDTAEFERLAASDRGRAALALVRGPAFDGFDGEPFDSARNHARVTQRTVRHRVLRTEIEHVDPAGLIAEIAAAVAADPLDEELVVLHMTALARSGRQADAIDAYFSLRSALADELGIDPGAEIDELHRRLVSGDPLDPTPAPRQLPAATALVGRDAALERLDGLTGPGDTRIAVVSGTAGAGKTALALGWAWRARRHFTDGSLFVDLRGFSGTGPRGAGDVLAGFVRALGYRWSLPGDIEELSALYRSLVHERRMVIVLDNARSVDQVRPLLPGGDGPVVVITSRESLVGLGMHAQAHTEELDPLDLTAAVELIRALVPDEVSRFDAEQLATQCARLPLALQIAARLSATCGQGVARLVAELEAHRNHLDRLDIGDDVRSDVRTVLSWSYEALDPRTRRMFRLLGLLPAQGAPETAVVALVGGDPGQARTDLRSLRRVHLVGLHEHGRYGQHDLLRAYARELAGGEPDSSTEAEARTRLLGYYAAGCADAAAALVPRWGPILRASDAGEPDDAALEAISPATRVGPFPDAAAAKSWLDDEHAAIADVVGSTGPEADARAIAIVLRLRPYLATQGWLTEARVLFADLLERTTRRDDPLGQATALRLLGAHDAHGIDYVSATRRLTRALDLSRTLGDSTGAAIALNNIAEMERLLGDPARAVELLDEAVQINADTGDVARLGLGHGNLALAHNALGNHEAAEAASRRALEAADRIGSERIRSLGLRAMAEAKLGLGSAAESAGLARTAYELALTLDDVEMEAWSAEVLGRALVAIDALEEAEQMFERAIESSRRGGSLAQLAPALRALATLREVNAPEEATRLLDEARAIGQRLRAGALGPISP
ncbi:AfsR/SARP family transcriptional regulator [Agromyces laixinhei]|uniref:AfsR/SARP family transcriptional regulator n=1 Tax=Agromyces laixinhei TaxID=2585717 RepID=UPI0012ED0FD9|nr:BTAD domain-containing putative transcriptional regulator [Agromyces laixinhei]